MFRIFCDFDGTITNRDSIVFLTERLGAGARFRHDVLARIKSGEISVFEAIERELATVKATWEEARGLLQRHISIDPTFEEFIAWCRREKHPVAVVSSGLQPVVSMFVGHLDVPIYAHPVDFRSEGWRYRRDPAQEKTTILAQLPEDGAKVVYVGDGTSDVAALPWVDWLFAKSYLSEYCRQNGVHYFPFDNFNQIRERLEKLKEETVQAPENEDA